MKINPAVRQIRIEDYHPPANAKPDWLEHGILAYSPLSNGLTEGHWLACFTSDPDDESTWHVTGGSIPFKGDRMRYTARPIGTMTMRRCSLFSDEHAATRLNIDMKYVGWASDKSGVIAAVGYGVLTGIALRQGHATLCAGACGWAVDERVMGRLREDPSEGAWSPDDTTDVTLHTLGYRVASYFRASGREAMEHLTLSRDDLLRVPLDQATSRLAGGIDQFIVGGVSHAGAELYPRALWLPPEVLAGN